MAKKTIAQLKSGRDFTDVLDSALNMTDGGTVAGVVALSAGIPTMGNAYTLVADAGNDTTITNLVSGYEYYFGTVTGVPGATDGNNAMTFRLPTPTAIGERIKITNTCAAAHAKLIGFSVEVPASETIYYIANDNGVFIEAATTVAGVDGTANSMVKLANSHGQIGDTYEAVSTSLTSWVLTINGRNGLIAAGDIAVDPGNAGGYID